MGSDAEAQAAIGGMNVQLLGGFCADQGIKGCWRRDGINQFNPAVPMTD